MLRLLALGILSALFFSSTFILNRAMSLAGGHWVWTASLRYGYMLLFLALWLLVTGKAALLRAVGMLFWQDWRFWIVAGSIGFGLFYATVTFSVCKRITSRFYRHKTKVVERSCSSTKVVVCDSDKKGASSVCPRS